MSITFLKRESGSEAPYRTGLRCPHDFGIAGVLNDGMHEFVEREWVSPGESVVSNLWLLYPEDQKNRFFEGFEFTMWGGRVIAQGRVLKVLNDELQKRS